MGFFVQLGSIVRSQRRADLYNFHFICRLETNIKKLKFVTFWNSLSFISATPVVDVLFSWMVSFVALSSVALLHQYVLLDHKLPLVIGSWGAASVLLFCTPESPLCQPWNLFVGSTISCITGISLQILFEPYPELFWLKVK
eukprot:TRINITY_DN3289_c0_g1_i1.p1 TRINITY_DN3289_c0_g1~~TRINITY_DN3289_c0_g1_i1.p1  ORF type:complete len:141 (-),score=13.55 TRINITY_DN3289_c0_g1_i1:453-875(-)